MKALCRSVSAKRDWDAHTRRLVSDYTRGTHPCVCVCVCVCVWMCAHGSACVGGLEREGKKNRVNVADFHLSSQLAFGALPNINNNSIIHIYGCLRRTVTPSIYMCTHSLSHLISISLFLSLSMRMCVCECVCERDGRSLFVSP